MDRLQVPGNELRMKGKNSRERLLEAAKVLLAQHGLDGTTTAAIARAAGTSQSQFIKHFCNKAGVLAAVYENGWAELVGAIRLAIKHISAPQQRLKQLLEMLMSYFETNPEFRLIFLREGPRRIGANIASCTAHEEFLALLDETLQQMRLAGELLPQTNIPALRSGLLGALTGLLYEKEAERSNGGARSYSDGEMRQTIFAFLSTFTTGANPLAVEGTDDAQPPWLTRYLDLAAKVLGPLGNA